MPASRKWRPADTAGNGATGEAQEAVPDDGKDPAAKALGAKGGRKRAETMTAERRAEIARKAAQARWAKQRPPPA